MRMWPNPESDFTGFWLNFANMKIAQALTLAHAARAWQASHKMHCQRSNCGV